MSPQLNSVQRFDYVGDGGYGYGGYDHDYVGNFHEMDCWTLSRSKTRFALAFPTVQTSLTLATKHFPSGMMMIVKMIMMIMMIRDIWRIAVRMV